MSVKILTRGDSVPQRPATSRNGLSRVAIFASALSIQLVTGCVVEPVLHETSVESAEQLDWSDWGLVLNRAVVEDRVNYKRILADPAPLERSLAMIARVGPESTPRLFTTNEDRLAYYINCYNMTIVRSVIGLAQGQTIPVKAPADLATRFLYRVDGTLWSPAQLREKAMELAGEDWRVWFALCDGQRSGPPLHPRPILGDLLDGQLTFVTRMALYAPNVVTIEIEAERRLLLWRRLYEIKDRMIADYERRMGTSHATIINALGEWSNRRRREYLNTAIGYIVAPQPVDNHINQLDAPAEPGGVSIF